MVHKMAYKGLQLHHKKIQTHRYACSQPSRFSFRSTGPSQQEIWGEWCLFVYFCIYIQVGTHYLLVWHLWIWKSTGADSPPVQTTWTSECLISSLKCHFWFSSKPGSDFFFWPKTPFWGPQGPWGHAWPLLVSENPRDLTKAQLQSGLDGGWWPPNSNDLNTHRTLYSWGSGNGIPADNKGPLYCFSHQQILLRLS